MFVRAAFSSKPSDRPLACTVRARSIWIWSEIEGSRSYLMGRWILNGPAHLIVITSPISLQVAWDIFECRPRFAGDNAAASVSSSVFRLLLLPPDPFVLSPLLRPSSSRPSASLPARLRPGGRPFAGKREREQAALLCASVDPPRRS